MTREAGDFVAGLGLGHLGVEGQVEEGVEEQPAVHIQERGEAAAAGGGERAPGPGGRGGSPRSPQGAARLHPRRGGHGPRCGGLAAGAAPLQELPLREKRSGQGDSNPPLPPGLPLLPSSRPRRRLLRPLQRRLLSPAGKPGSPQPAAPSPLRPSSSRLIVFFHGGGGGGGGELPLDLGLSPRQTRPPLLSHRHTHTQARHPPPCSPGLPLLLCSPAARGTHAGSGEEERGEAGAAAVLSPLSEGGRAPGPLRQPRTERGGRRLGMDQGAPRPPPPSSVSVVTPVGMKSRRLGGDEES